VAQYPCGAGARRYGTQLFPDTLRAAVRAQPDHPGKLSRSLLEFVFPDRKPDGDNPKFPAHYNYCFSEEDKIVPMLQSAGFLDITVLPFWGYSYFVKFPVLKQIDAAFTQLAQKRDWRTVSSFAYVIVRK
jgi:hypothetical protein